MKIGFIFLCFATLTLIKASKKKPPHFIFIVGDDMGYNDVGWHNKKMYTPHLDHLAGTGIILEQHYAMPACTPSRAALLTGLYPSLLGLQRGVLKPLSTYGIPTKFKLLPARLKEAGYSTHAIGKWHLGFCSKKYTPLYRGFDTFLGFYNGAEDNIYHCLSPHMIHDFHKCFGIDMNDNGKTGYKYTGVYSTELYSRRAVDIIEQHDKDKPLFMYLSYSGTHFPLDAPKKYFKNCQQEVNQARKNFCAATVAVDEGVAEVTKALKDGGFYNNSIIIFVSDNGGTPEFGGNNYPLRGRKGTLWEGGTRTPAFIHSPLLDKNKFVYNGLFHIVDWFPTLLHLAGLKTDSELNGINQWESLTKNEFKREEFLYNMDIIGEIIKGAVRKGDYKLFTGPGGDDTTVAENETMDHTDDADYMIAHFGKGSTYSTKSLTDNRNKLYNVKDDPEEKHDLSKQEPEKLKELWELANHYKEIMKPAVVLPEDPKGDPRNSNNVFTYGWCNACYDIPNQKQKQC